MRGRAHPVGKRFVVYGNETLRRGRLGQHARTFELGIDAGEGHMLHRGEQRWKIGGQHRNHVGKGFRADHPYFDAPEPRPDAFVLARPALQVRELAPQLRRFAVTFRILNRSAHDARPGAAPSRR